MESKFETGEDIIEYCKNNYHLSQNELADLIGGSKSTITHWKKEKDTFRLNDWNAPAVHLLMLRLGGIERKNIYKQGDDLSDELSAFMDKVKNLLGTVDNDEKFFEKIQEKVRQYTYVDFEEKLVKYHDKLENKYQYLQNEDEKEAASYSKALNNIEKAFPFLFQKNNDDGMKTILKEMDVGDNMDVDKTEDHVSQSERNIDENIGNIISIENKAENEMSVDCETKLESIAEDMLPENSGQEKVVDAIVSLENQTSEPTAENEIEIQNENQAEENYDCEGRDDMMELEESLTGKETEVRNELEIKPETFIEISDRPSEEFKSDLEIKTNEGDHEISVNKSEVETKTESETVGETSLECEKERIAKAETVTIEVNAISDENAVCSIDNINKADMTEDVNAKKEIITEESVEETKAQQSDAITAGGKESETTFNGKELYILYEDAEKNRDTKKSLDYLTRSAHSGYAAAQLELGKRMLKNAKETYDDNEAKKGFELLLLAEDQEDDLITKGEAVFEIGICFLSGEGVEYNYKDGMDCLRDACSLGVVRAFSELDMQKAAHEEEKKNKQKKQS